ncbi:spore coat protein YlbD [Jeotgalibacillus haloalkalitolerans]|uniref:Spore coat protein YlbD n=1 Tax=Jeotgalibacillus haloalkalitolerans TaxID=3104292 RepID=A0ABU5KJU6_9BACL|nr:spore coat protein YlbD [Jeotgalibacillus sp. HH7-29]MDZ5711537.1 spore coat protein YlbD [Jeotgalibacillus sp. HH7-29]
MSTQRLDEFKVYLKKHPELVQKVRRQELTWQELYEEWLLLGDDKGSGIEFDQIFSSVKEKIQHFDPAQIEEYSKRLQSGLDFFQEMLNHFNKQNDKEDDILMKQWKQ